MKYTKRAIWLAHKNDVLPRLRKQMIIHEVRKKYDADDELAVLRQAKTKPEEYEMYFAYVEKCKKRVDDYVKEVLGGEG